MFKNINWKNLAITFAVAVVAIVSAPLWLDPAKSIASKIPGVGPKLG